MDMRHPANSKVFKVCHVCSGHSSDDSRVLHKECRSLAQEGYEVHLIAADTSSKSYKSGNVIIHPLPRYASSIRRMSQRWAVADIAARISADLYHVHEPELLGPVLDRVGNTPVIYDVHESYLDVLGHRSWIPKPIRPLAQALWGNLEPRLVKRCRAIVAVSEPIAEPYSRIHSSVVIIRNFPNLSTEDLSGASSHDHKRACVFAGTLKEDRNLQNMVRAIGLLRRRGLAVPLWLAGRWATPQYEQEIWRLAAEEGVKDQIHYSGVLPHKEALALESHAGIGMVTILPIQNSLKTLPIKIFECMALGLPLIYSNFPILKDYIDEYHVGLSVDPESPAQIADAVELLLGNPEMSRQMGQAGKRAVAERFNWPNECAKLLSLYRSILDPQGSKA